MDSQDRTKGSLSTMDLDQAEEQTPGTTAASSAAPIEPVVRQSKRDPKSVSSATSSLESKYEYGG